MAQNIKTRIANLLLSKKKHTRYVGIVACMALIVTLGVVASLRQSGIAMTHEETVLDCHYDGGGAHTHNADCYDGYGNLVCPLAERELHVHDDSCYTTETHLVCGLDEYEGHTHTDACYDEEGNLVCGQEESEGHTHTDACYETTRTLTCGKEEVTEEHVHGPGCFKTITVKDEEPAKSTDTSETKATTEKTKADPNAEMPAQVFDHQLKDEHGKVVLTVHVEAPEGAFPKGTTMHVKPVEAKDIQDAVDRAVADKTDAKVTDIQAVDITFRNKDNQEIEPATNITVELKSALIADNDDPYIVHVDDKGKADVVDTLDDRQIVEHDMKPEDDKLVFDSDKFSTYGIVITSLHGTLTASDGQTYDVDVDVPAAAGIPQGSELEVHEIVEGTEGYDVYREAAANMVDGDLSYARFFDISIVKDGQKVQPEEQVQVKISLHEDPAAVSENVQVLHFADESITAETVDATNNGEQITFDANGFSVYAVVGTETIRTDFLASDGNLYDVTVRYSEDAQIPDGSALRVTEIERGTTAYNDAYKLLFNEEPGEDAPMMAVDISIVDPNGNVIEPQSAVTVDFIMKSLPDGVEPEALQESVEIHHLKKNSDGITVEKVANSDQIQVNDGISAVFNVDEFSTFTITYNYYGNHSLPVTVVTTKGISIGTDTSLTLENNTVSVSAIAPQYNGYTFSKATIGGINGTQIRRIRYNNGWQYNVNNSGGSWTYLGNNTVNFVYTSDTPYVKVYVYVAAYDEQGNQFKDNPEFLELLGISGDTVDGNGYFPVGEIYIDEDFFVGKTTNKWAALIHSAEDWEQVLSALGELNTSTLVYDSYNTPTDYSHNVGNSVGDYMAQAIGDINMGAGSQHTALFGWNGHSYGFEDQSVGYHLDLRFQTNRVTFITGNNGISSGASKDGTTVDVRAYIVGSPIQQPRNLVIPDGYRLVGFYNDPNFTTPWNKIGTPITQDEVAYIKITPEENVVLYYKPVPVEGGTVSVDAEGVNPATGTPNGSTAIPNQGYTFVGWYADEECTQLLSTNPSFVPTKSGDRWVDGTTYYAKFEEDTVNLKFIAEDHIDHVELVTDAGEVISVTGDKTKDMTVTINKVNGPSVTVRGVAENGYVVKEWTIDGRTGALTTNEAIDTAIADDPSATEGHWTDRTYHVWAEVAKKVNVDKEVRHLGALHSSEINTTVYFELWDEQKSDNVRDENGDIVIKSIDIVNGVPEGTVSFEGLQSGTYSVWEVDENGEDMHAGTIVIGEDIVISKIETRHGTGSGNRATVSDDNPTDDVTVINTYNHRSDVTHWTVSKKWYTTPNHVQEDAANKDIPEGATSTLALYRTDDLTTPLQTVVLDGVRDENGESASWVASFDELQLKDEDGNPINYIVKEIAFTPERIDAGYFYPYEGQTNHDGGVIRNAVISGNINVYKQIEVQPRNEEMNSLVANAVGNLRIHVTGPHDYDETFTFTNVTDPYNLSLQITNLPAGEYTVEELEYEDLLTGRKWNPTLSWIKAGKNNSGEEQSGETKITFEVATNGQNNDSVDVRIKNDYTKYDVVATKVWDDQGAENVYHPAVTLALYRIDSEDNRSLVGTKTIGANQTGEGLTVKWEQQEQQEQQYTYEIVEYPVAGYTCTSINGDMFTGFTVTNSRTTAVKVVKTDQEGNALAGATFDDVSGGLIKNGPVTTEITGEEGSEEAIVVADAILPGTYTIRETDAPDGFHPLPGDVTIEVDSLEGTGQIVVNATIDGKESAFVEAELADPEHPENGWVVTIKNDTGVALPHTGGVGTAIYGITGSMLIAGALTYGLISRRRRERRLPI